MYIGRRKPNNLDDFDHKVLSFFFDFREEWYSILYRKTSYICKNESWLYFLVTNYVYIYIYVTLFQKLSFKIFKSEIHTINNMFYFVCLVICHR